MLGWISILFCHDDEKMVLIASSLLESDFFLLFKFLPAKLPVGCAHNKAKEAQLEIEKAQVF